MFLNNKTRNAAGDRIVTPRAYNIPRLKNSKKALRSSPLKMSIRLIRHAEVRAKGKKRKKHKSAHKSMRKSAHKSMHKSAHKSIHDKKNGSRRKSKSNFNLGTLPLLNIELQSIAALSAKNWQRKETTPVTFDPPMTSPLFQPFLGWMQDQPPSHQNQLKVVTLIRCNIDFLIIVISDTNKSLHRI